MLQLCNNCSSTLTSLLIQRSNRCYIHWLSESFRLCPTQWTLVKLWNIGITGSLWTRIKYIYIYIVQCVSEDNHLSDTSPVISDVPQGRILGPLCFFLYLSMICHLLLHYSYLNLQMTLNVSDITWYWASNSLFNWSTKNCFSFNLSNFVFI